MFTWFLTLLKKWNCILPTHIIPLYLSYLTYLLILSYLLFQYLESDGGWYHFIISHIWGYSVYNIIWIWCLLLVFRPTTSKADVDHPDRNLIVSDDRTTIKNIPGSSRRGFFYWNSYSWCCIPTKSVTLFHMGFLINTLIREMRPTSILCQAGSFIMRSEM